MFQLQGVLAYCFDDFIMKYGGIFLQLTRNDAAPNCCCIKGRINGEYWYTTIVPPSVNARNEEAIIDERTFDGSIENGMPEKIQSADSTPRLLNILPTSKALPF